jgi:hypothetical protein
VKLCPQNLRELLEAQPQDASRPLYIGPGDTVLALPRSPLWPFRPLEEDSHASLRALQWWLGLTEVREGIGNLGSAQWSAIAVDGGAELLYIVLRVQRLVTIAYFWVIWNGEHG